MTLRARFLSRDLLFGALILALLVPGAAWAATPVSLATHSVGSLYNAQGTAMAIVVTKHSSLNVRVRPFAGPPAWFPDMNAGLIEFGVITGADAAMGYRGVLLYHRKFQNLRLVLSGGALRVGFIVRRNSGIEKVADLKGKRVPVDFPGTPISSLGSRAGLATANLTLKDVVGIPVADLQGNVQAFLEGRTDAMWYSVGGPAVREANARIPGGVRFIPLVNTPGNDEKVDSILPGSYVAMARAGAPGVIENTPLLTLDIYIVTSKATP